MAKVMNRTSSIRMAYEFPGEHSDKTIRKSKTFANIKTNLSDDAIVTFGQNVLKLQTHSGKIQKLDAKELANE